MQTETSRFSDNDEPYRRSLELYQNLSEEDRRFIVTQWDFQNGLEGPIVRLRKKEQAPHFLRRRKIYSYLVVLVVLIAGSVIITDYKNARQARKKLAYIYDKSSESRPLAVGLKWVDDELQGSRDPGNGDESDSGLRPTF